MVCYVVVCRFRHIVPTWGLWDALTPLRWQVAAAVADATGPELVGFRLSPFSSFLDATDPETLDLNLYLVDKVRAAMLASW